MRKLIALALLLSGQAYGASVTFDWEPSVGATPQTTYRLYCGQAPGVYGSPVTMTAKPFSKEMASGVYFCAATAVEPALGESAKSNEVKVVVTLPAPTNLRTVTIIYVQ